MKTPTILIVEDDEENMYVLTVMLRPYGYQLIQARDGYQGLEATRQAKPDLILLDLLLPGLDGYTVAQQLRNDPAFANVPIIAVSSLPLLSNEKRALAAGCNDYLEKPIDRDILIAKVQEYLTPTSDQEEETTP